MTLVEFKVGVLRDEICNDIFEQIGLVTLEGGDIAVAAIDDQLTSFFWVLMASKANTTPLRANFGIKSGKALISFVLRSTS